MFINERKWLRYKLELSCVSVARVQCCLASYVTSMYNIESLQFIPLLPLDECPSLFSPDTS